jgi:transcriptional regulator with PAS, ATPase and Fis domain
MGTLAQYRAIPGARSQEITILAAAAHTMCVVTDPVVRSDSLKKLVKLVQQVARHPAAVLIAGETGSGKEMIARSIHNYSLRCNQPWVDVNCAAIPEHLVESELFGYEKGAFSGADRLKPGLFELADKGTLFLDEIGDLDIKIQVKLLRVLDGVPYYRLGGSRKISVDVRVVAATNQNLEELVRTGRFRSDLYHRLAQFKLEIPPLRQRPEDVLGIAEQMLAQHAPAARLSSDATAALLAYDWPGNVRELKSVVLRALVHAADPEKEITAADLQLAPPAPPKNETVVINGDLNQVERQTILQALERCGGNQGKAAEALGISRRTLLRKLKIYRQNGTEAPAAASAAVPDQERYYRATVNAPVRMKVGGKHIQATLLNISVGGASIAMNRHLDSEEPVTLFFSIPQTGLEAELKGTVAWSDRQGQHGIQFTDLAPQVSSALQCWLASEMRKNRASLECA